jgi:hypothetical protein
MKAVVLNESTGWTVTLVRDNGERLPSFYVSARHHGSPHQEARRVAAHYGAADVTFEYAGNSPDYEREMKAIAADPYFMS